jgi:hypothetical protein
MVKDINRGIIMKGNPNPIGNKKLLRCPACAYTYNNNNSKKFGHYRVYMNIYQGEEYIILKCRKCGSCFKYYQKGNKITLVPY